MEIDKKRGKVTDEHRQEAARLKEIWNSESGKEYRRRNHAVTQESFGATFGVGNQAAVGSFLNGTTALSLKAAVAFADGLGVKVRDFSPRLAKLLPSRQHPAEMHMLQFLARHGILDVTQHAHDSPPSDLPEWMNVAGRPFVPDFRVVGSTGTVGWIELKPKEHAPSSLFVSLHMLARMHPEFILVPEHEISSQAVVNWIGRLNGVQVSTTTQADADGSPEQYLRRALRVVHVGSSPRGHMHPDMRSQDGALVETPPGVALVFSSDQLAFAFKVEGSSMAPRFMPGEFALVEPSTDPEIEDDVLVRLESGQTLLRRLLSRRSGVRLGCYATAEVLTVEADEIAWMYYVAHPIPSRRVEADWSARVPELSFDGIDPSDLL